MNADDADCGPRETADVETSTDAYAARFAGRVGQWMMQRQEKMALALLDAPGPLSILDVGGGHGQLARPLSVAGHRVTVLGSAPECVHRIADLTAEGKLEYLSGDVMHLPFCDSSYDVVISFRMVTHCSRWENFIGELCRVARSKVIVDYPTIQSVNCLAALLFGLKRRIEGDTRPWTLFRHAQIDAAFAAANWKVIARKKQFFMPMVMYRMLGSRRIAGLIEGTLRGVGLTACWGSPVILCAEPLRNA